MRIHVIEEDINNGIKWSPCACPVAIAIKRSTTTLLVRSVSIGCRYIHIGTPLDNKFIRTPEEVMDFIHKFDTGQPVTTFTFELDI